MSNIKKYVCQLLKLSGANKTGVVFSILSKQKLCLVKTAQKYYLCYFMEVICLVALLILVILHFYSFDQRRLLEFGVCYISLLSLGVDIKF